MVSCLFTCSRMALSLLGGTAPDARLFALDSGSPEVRREDCLRLGD